MNNTALSANLQTIEFASENHRDFYEEYLLQCRHQDVYHKALIYCVGISADTRNHFHSIYDIERGYVKTECLREGWITSGSSRIVRMAFNLYCNGTPSANDYEDAEEQMDEMRAYTVEDLFCCEYASYFWQAVKIRYPEYCSKKAGALC
ncbi:MAG: DUF6075 family protein [Lachnospiraceae bacterium]|nr:DUF6075 family protein [Lachnospiraceae bacterium]